MKIYCFYIHDHNIDKFYGVKISNIQKIENLDHSFALYGWTTSKKIARKFKEERSSNFFMKKVNMDDSDYNKFKSDNPNLEIDFYDYLTEVKAHDGSKVIRTVNIVSTEYEHSQCVWDVDVALLDGENLLKIFDSYEDAQIEYLNPELFYYLFQVLKIEGVYNLIYTFTDRAETSVYFNQLALFCRLFSNTFNERMINQ